MKYKVECGYKIQLENKFDGKPYCTCFCKKCKDLPICDDNCQIFEDYKTLIQKKKEVEHFQHTVKRLCEENRDLFNKNLELEGENVVLKTRCEKLNKLLDYTDKQFQEAVKTKCSDCESVVIADNKKLCKSYSESLDENHCYRNALEEIKRYAEIPANACFIACIEYSIGQDCSKNCFENRLKLILNIIERTGVE